jgi:hypothetical protein
VAGVTPAPLRHFAQQPNHVEPFYPVEAIERGFLGERAFAEEIWGRARKSGWRKTSQSVGITMPPKGGVAEFVADYAWFPLYRLTSMNADELFCLKATQETLIGVRLLEAHRPWQKAKQHFDLPGIWINQVASFPKRLRYWGSLMAMPNFVRAADTGVRIETERQMTLTAIALKRFQLRHGKLPSDLAALVPEFLPALPYDPMSGKTLCYHLKPDGSFVLYSVGQDGLDDKGDPNPASGTKFGLWEGRDAVWPAAVQ